jgi:predicted  nucleic acid-binding Zn-ribbon protein
MIEPVMYFGIGFLVAALLGLLFVPLVHNRAVRLTSKRLEAATPLSIAEIRADKDQLRAEFAMSTRRLEMSVAQMKTKTTTQLSELGKKTDAINQLKKELSDKTATVFALESRDKTLREQLRATEQEFEIKGNALREAERALADKEGELVKLIAELGEHAITSDQQRVELAALRTQVEAMKVSVSDYDRTLKVTEHRMTREREDAQSTTADLNEIRRKAESLSAHAAELEQQLITQTDEAQSLHTRVEELEALLGNQARLLAERDFQVEKLRNDVEAARRAEADLRSELAAVGSRGNSAEDSLRAEIKQLEVQLAASADARSKLQREVATIKREADSTWASERVENALLRERINDVAAEVARLTAALEGPDSPILSMLEEDAPSLAEGGLPTARRAERRGAPDLNGTPHHGEAGLETGREKKSLADRIRALQSSASRLASSN